MKLRRNDPWFALLALALLLSGQAASGGDQPGNLGGLTLVADGKPRAVLVLSQEAFAYQPDQGRRKSKRAPPANPLATEKEAAAEIQAYCQKISGAALPMVAAGDDLKGLAPIYVGSAADTRLAAAVNAKGSDPCAFALVVSPAQASIRGLSVEGTFCGVCELLEQLGVRWFWPGELGTVIPKSQTVVLPPQTTIQVPSFPSRHLSGIPADWERQLRGGGPRFPSAHGIRLGISRDRLFEDHPEFHALIDGHRSSKQLCLSNPELLKLTIESTKQFFRDNPQSDIIGMGANDGRGFCQCERCRALDAGDYDPFGHCESMSDRYVWFFNQVLAGIRDEFPSKQIGFYAYAAYCRPPRKVRPDPRIVPAVAMISLCRLHGMNNPVCPEKNYEQWIIQQWGKLVPEVYYRGYWFNLADPGLPFFMIRRIADEVPLGKRLNIAGWRTECNSNWAGAGPSLYLAYKLMWNHTQDAQVIVDDYCQKFFGPAAVPMGRYIDLMDRTVYEADHHAGSIWDMARVYAAPVRAQAAQWLDEAARAAAPGSPYAQRVAAFRKSFAFLQGFIDVMDGQAVHDFGRAKQGLERMIAVREELSSASPALISKKAHDYMDRYLTSTVTQGYARTTGGNRLLAALSDRWRFQIDPERVGEAIGWFDPSGNGGNWQTLCTSSRTWSDQGLRYYKGLAWYRQIVDIPAAAKGQRVFLWFGAIDEAAKVWVNGRSIGISPRARANSGLTGQLPKMCNLNCENRNNLLCQ